MDHIGVIGAGLMGSGIAHTAALAGRSVILADIALDRATQGKQQIAKHMGAQVTKGRLTQADMDGALDRIRLTADMADMAQAGFVIEAATENEEVKRKIFASLCPHLAPNAILASNTSSIPITRLAAATDRADRFIGLHFFNPVPVMKLIEIIRGLATSDATTSAAHDLAQALGKSPVESLDRPAFIVNRLLCPMLNEAIFALGEGVGNVADIDTAMRLGANHPMGPLTLADFIGLDTLLAIMEVLLYKTGDPKYRPAPLLLSHVDAGWLGRKSGRGFYDYATTPPTPLSPR